jgi:hypothetical protein
MISPLLPTNDEQWPVFFILDEDAHTVRPAINHVEWKEWMDTDPDRRVAKTLINGYRVSTIFWGIAEYGPDKLFETILFRGDAPTDLAAWRCASWDEAVQQHERACAWVREQFTTGALPPLPQAEPSPRIHPAAAEPDDDELGALTNWDIVKPGLKALFLPRMLPRRFGAG